MAKFLANTRNKTLTRVACKSEHPPEEQYTIIDIGPLSVAPKVIPPVEEQLPHESLRL